MSERENIVCPLKGIFRKVVLYNLPYTRQALLRYNARLQNIEHSRKYSYAVVFFNVAVRFPHARRCHTHYAALVHNGVEAVRYPFFEMHRQRRRKLEAASRQGVQQLARACHKCLAVCPRHCVVGVHYVRAVNVHTVVAFFHLVVGCVFVVFHILKFTLALVAGCRYGLRILFHNCHFQCYVRHPKHV